MCTLRIGDSVGAYRINTFLKSVSHNRIESYIVSGPEKEKAMLKLFNMEGVSSGMLTKKGYLLEGDICSELSGKIFARTFVYDNIDIQNRNYHYWVREYLDGKRLSDALAEGKRYDWEEAVAIIRQVLMGLSALCHLPQVIIHNDVTPRNVLLCNSEEGDQTVRLIGTGHLSRRTNGVPAFCTSDLNVWYRAPETFTGMFDEQSDIFSVAVMLYTMLAGEEPWKVELPEKANLRVIKKLVKEARESGETVLDKLDLTAWQKQVLKKALALDYSKRFRSADDFCDALEKGDVHRSVGKGEGMEKKRTDGSEKESTETSKEENVFGEAIQKCIGIGFAGVAGMEMVKSVFQKDVLFILKNREKVKQYRLKAPNGALLYGPVGCGKTFFAEKFAQESGLNFMMVKASDLGSIYIHGTQGKIAELFTEAERKAPTVLCFDEIEGMVPDRSKVTNEGQAGEVNEFLCQLNNCSERGIFVIGTTNRPDKIDSAVLRTGRIDKMIYIPLPDQEARKALFRLHLQDRFQEEDIDCEELAEQTEGYTASDIAYIVNETALTAAMQDIPINQQLLRDEVCQARSSVTREQAKEYEALRNKMESIDDRRGRRPIGFATYGG